MKRTRKKIHKQPAPQKVIECRCSPKGVYDMINSFSPEQKIEVDKMRFSSLRAIPNWNIDRRLFLALARAFYPMTSKLELVLGEIDVTTEKISAALGLPSVGKSFPEEWTSEQEGLIAPFKSVNRITLKEILASKDCNVSTSKGRDHFRRTFIMFLVDSFLAPTSCSVTSPKHLPTIVDVQNITIYNNYP
ncbi:hypothetical protein PIB30_097138 [Stylosanthes scabra]|uniref:Uncharacterized protein n=1 Tax=Stylosanthes scabra TaxID=79078 RepID=A0ABU6SXG9_9FABA|nr:hypothetical protein [Stylosanthes scabra]